MRLAISCESVCLFGLGHGDGQMINLLLEIDIAQHRAPLRRPSWPQSHQPVSFAGFTILVFAEAVDGA